MDARFSWPEGLFALSAVVFLFQLFPAFFLAILSTVDVRLWTWRSYAVVCSVGIVALVGVKAWQNR